MANVPFLFFYLVFDFMIWLVHPRGGTLSTSWDQAIYLEVDKDKHYFFFVFFSSSDKHDSVFLFFFSFFFFLLLQLVEVVLAVLMRKFLPPEIQSERFVFACCF